MPGSAIRWVKPREAWWLNRRFLQPHALFPDFMRGSAIQFEAMADAASLRELFERLESKQVFLRIDPSVQSDAEKNRLCPPIAYWDANVDYPLAFLASLANDQALAAHPTLAEWARSTRLNPLSGMAAHRDDPGVIDAYERIRRCATGAVKNLRSLLAAGRA